MKLEYQYLLELMGCFLTQTAPEVRREVDWGKLMKLSDIHSVSGILGYMDMQYRLCQDPDHSVSLRKNTLLTMGKFIQRIELGRKFSQMLHNAGIQHILMKGAVVRDYYPVPELRTFGDIDIVIRPEDRELCHALMLDAGFKPKVDWGPVYSYVRGMEFYEIHTDIMETNVSDKADYQGYFQRMWQHTAPMDDGTLAFTPEFHFLYLLTHIAKHVSGSGAGIRMYIDIAAFILHFREGIDWPWIEAELKKLKLWDFAQVVFSAVENWFGVSCPVAFETVADDVMVEFLNYTLDAGIFGHYRRELAMAKLKKDPESISRWKLLLKRMFPAAETIQARYTYLQGKPWLLPAAWIHRAVKTRDSLGRHAHEARVILNADESEVACMHRLMRDIGL